MSRIHFDRLLDKYLAGKCSAEERELVEQWYALLDNPDLESPKDIEILKNTIWHKIQKDIKPVAKVTPLWQKSYFKYAIAASLLLVVSASIFLFEKKQISTNLPIDLNNAEILTLKNTSDKIISLTLEDSSRIDLSPDAELSYPKRFSSDKRQVTLRGEAFFQIAKNPSKPFFVYANQTTTKVLGTSFTIKALKNEKIVTVLVKTGKVSVYTTAPRTNKQVEKDPETQGVVLTPNQKAVFDLKTENIQKEVVEKPSILIPLSVAEEFSFSDTPVSKVFEAMEKTYGIDIVYDEEVLKNCTITTTLTDIPMFNKLKIICSAIGATYKEIDAQIVITAKGC